MSDTIKDEEDTLQGHESGYEDGKGNAIEQNDDLSSPSLSIDTETAKEADTAKSEKAQKKADSNLVNKRIDFDPKALKRIEMMIPAFRDEVGESASANDVMSYIIGKGIDALFEGDFKKKIEEM